MKLNELVEDSNISVVERAAKVPGVLSTITAKVAEVEKENRNGRVYEASCYDNFFESEKFNFMIDNKKFFGEADHPEGIETSIPRISHRVSKNWREGEDIMATMEVLDTPMGRIVDTLLKSGSVLGVSSRALGETKEDEDGTERVISEGFDLLAYDFVVDQSAFGCLASIDSRKVRDISEGIRSFPDFEKDSFYTHILEACDKRLEEEGKDDPWNKFKDPLKNLKEKVPTELVDGLTEEVKTLKADKETQASVHKEHLENVRTSASTLRQKAEALKKDLIDANKRIKFLETRLERAPKPNKKQEEHLEGMKKELEVSKKSAETLGEKYRSLQQETQEKITTLGNSNVELQGRNVSLKESNTELDRRVKHLGKMRVNTSGLPGNDLKAPGRKVEVKFEKGPEIGKDGKPVKRTAQESRLYETAKTALKSRG